jgi:hypothetical protein
VAGGRCAPHVISVCAKVGAGSRLPRRWEGLLMGVPSQQCVLRRAVSLWLLAYAWRVPCGGACYRYRL